MNRSLTCGLALAIALLCLPPSVRAAASEEEQRLVGVLRADKPPAEKDGACQRLKHIGTAASVPALAALLPNDQLTHSARYVLESMACPEAGAALRAALATTKGAAKAGVIDSLGMRRDTEAVGALVPLVGDPDEMIAASAAAALGRIGGKQAVQTLQAAKAKAPAKVRRVVLDALLRCADHLRAAGEGAAASAIYKQTFDSKAPELIRVAAFRGYVLAAGDGAAALVVHALKGSDEAALGVALQSVCELEGGAATKAFAAAVQAVPSGRQVHLLDALRRRGDSAAAPAIVAAMKGAAPPVRIAALRALAVLGDASTVPLLAATAANAKGPERDAARAALASLRGAAVREAMLALLAKAQPAVQAELASALGRRREPEAVPALLAMAGGPEAPARLAAMRSLGLLVDASAVQPLLKLIAGAKSDAEQGELEKALAAACARSKQPQALAGPVLAAAKGASVPARCTLLRVAARLGGPEALKALRTGLKDDEPAVREAVVRGMAEFGGPEMAPDLLGLASKSPSPAHQVLALRGYWRIVGLAADRPASERLEMCQAGLSVSKRPEEKKLGLTELAKVRHLQALKLAQSLCTQEAVRGEAELASVRIAASLVGSHPTEAKAALLRIKAESKNAATRTEAAKALDAMEQYVGFIDSWLVAGPYRQKGKECAQLYDIPFPPEQPEAKVTWRPAPRPADGSAAWQVVLDSVVGGDHCIVYVKSRVFAPKAMPVRLDIGTDDGVKLWVNGKLVHANNAIRGFTPNQDRARAALKEGWNDFLAKITQHTMGCAACIRIRQLNGSVIDGLRSDSGAARP